MLTGQTTQRSLFVASRYFITLRKNDQTEQSNLTIAIAADTGFLTLRTIQAKELSEPAGMIPIGTDMASFWLSLLKIKTSYTILAQIWLTSLKICQKLDVKIPDKQSNSPLPVP